jgi:hypothetical protein
VCVYSLSVEGSSLSVEGSSLSFSQLSPLEEGQLGIVLATVLLDPRDSSVHTELETQPTYLGSFPVLDCRL